MLTRTVALACLLLTCSLLPSLASAQQAELDQLQQALDELEVAEALVQGKITNATRDQALEQLRDARMHIQAVQAAMVKAHAERPAHPGASITVTETEGGAGASVQVGGPGASLSINLNVNDPGPVERPVVVEAPPPPPPAGPVPMPPAAFASLKGAIQVESFSDGKLRVLRSALADHHLEVQQAAQLLPLYDFSSDRVEAAVAIHPRLVDPQNFYQLYASFDFESDKEEVRKRLGL
jgi:hypothetical protein